MRTLIDYIGLYVIQLGFALLSSAALHRWIETNFPRTKDDA